MAESTRARKSRAAKQAAASAEGQAMAREVRYFNRRALAETRGPLVVEMFLPVLSGPPPKEGLPDVPDVAIRLLDAVPVDDDAVRAVYAQTGRALDAWCRTVVDVSGMDNRPRFLVKRPNLLTMIGAGVLPEPITAMVRQLMLYGPQAVETDHSRAQYEEMILALMRATVIVPPAAVEDGSLAVADITPDMCRPLFVAPGEVPAEDQYVLVGPLYDAAAPGDVDPELVFQVYQVDLTSFLMQLMLARQGAAHHFRRPREEQADAVEAGNAVEGGGEQRAPVEDLVA